MLLPTVQFLLNLVSVLHHLLQLLEIRLTNHEKQVANYPANRQIFRDQMTNHIKGQMDSVNRELQTRKKQ